MLTKLHKNVKIQNKVSRWSYSAAKSIQINVKKQSERKDEYRK